MQPWARTFKRSLSLCHTHAANAKLLPQKGDRVVVAMSGGVDSSVVARLLAEKDYNLSAVYMRNWDTRDESGTDSGCEWKKDWEDVQHVCRMLDIPTQLVDLSRQYWTRVFEPALRLWESGRCPNPDVWCNKEVKFGALLDHFQNDNVWIATGHYAAKSWSLPPSTSQPLSEPNVYSVCRPKLMRPVDRSKDQTYFLSSIPESSLARAFFPLADFRKVDVRTMAQKWALPTAQREESMGICFVGEKRRFDTFLSEYITPNPGPMVDLTTGKILGTHRGLWTYTVGQNARIPGMAQKMFVAKKDVDANAIYLVPGTNHAALYHQTLLADDWHWIWADSPPAGIDLKEGFRAQCQFIYRMEPVSCTVRRGSERQMHITFDEPLNHIAPGQTVTISDGDWCLGGGTIVESK